MERLLKYIGLLVAVGLGFIYILVNHSIADETQIVCKGSFYQDGKALDEEEIYFKFQKYRWWVHLWSDSDGTVHIDRNGTLDYIHNIKIVGGWGDVVFEGDERGRYSAMSRTMRYISGKDVFEGKCVDRI